MTPTADVQSILGDLADRADKHSALAAHCRQAARLMRTIYGIEADEPEADEADDVEVPTDVTTPEKPLRMSLRPPVASTRPTPAPRVPAVSRPATAGQVPTRDLAPTVGPVVSPTLFDDCGKHARRLEQRATDILTLVRDTPDISPGVVAKKLGITRMMVTKVLRRLISHGLIVATGSTNNRRLSLAICRAISVVPLPESSASTPPASPAASPESPAEDAPAHGAPPNDTMKLSEVIEAHLRKSSASLSAREIRAALLPKIPVLRVQLVDQWAEYLVRTGRVERIVLGSERRYRAIFTKHA